MDGNPSEIRLGGGPHTLSFGNLEPMMLRVPCGAPAPVALNGMAYLGCALTKGHAGRHEIRVAWDDTGISLPYMDNGDDPIAEDGDR